MPVELPRIVKDFARAIQVVDGRWPQAVGRHGRVYRAGIGPHAEEKAVRLIVAELRKMNPSAYKLARTRIPYPGSRQTCDLGIGTDPDWSIEIKMARAYGDNGKYDDTSPKDILSPYERDRSALTDCLKLARSRFPGHKGVLIYGFDDVTGVRPLHAIVDAFEVLARAQLERMHMRLGNRFEAPFADLVHPIHGAGTVFAWELAEALRQGDHPPTT